MNVHTRQIKAYVTEALAPLVDLSDTGPHDRESKLLTRGITILAAMRVAEIEQADAIASITDGSQDNGIDAIVVSNAGNGRLYLFQSKWNDAGTKTIEVGDTHKFLQGCRDVLACNWDRFNAKIKSKSADIERALNQVSTQVILVVVYTSTNPVPDESQLLIDKFLRENNEGGELVTFQTIRLAQLKSAAAGQIAGEISPCEATFFEWGKVHKPYEAIYGQVACSDVAAWHENNGVKLFAPNIRTFLGSTEVNQGIMQTLRNEPEVFWYMNNGITAICDVIRKKPIGGNTNDSSVYVFDNLRVVNGAQTVSSIGVMARTAAENVAKARVLVRVISKSESPLNFEEQLTTRTNTQNRIEARDFIALDPTQIRLKTELLAKGIDYVFRAGETAAQTNSFDVQEAAIALACSKPDVSLAVFAKRNIGELLNRASKQYGTLFTDTLTGDGVWRAVCRLRSIDKQLNKLAESRSGRENQLLIHGNRVFAHVAFNISQFWLQDANKFPVVSPELVDRTVAIASAYIAQHYADAYLQVLFKNTDKCETLAAAISSELGQVQGLLAL